MDINYSRPSLAVELKGVKDSLLDARNRGIRTRFITEISFQCAEKIVEKAKCVAIIDFFSYSV